MNDTAESMVGDRSLVDEESVVEDRSLGAGGGRGPCPAELVQAVRRSEPGAMDALMARFDKLVRSIAWRNGMSATDVEDVSQEVWLKCFVHIRSIRQPERVASWLVTTTHHECMRAWRQQGRIVLVADMGAIDLAADDVVGERHVEAQDRDVQLRALVTTLPRRQRAVIDRLMSNPTPSYLEVADDLGVPVGSIGPTRGRGLRTLHAGCVGAGIGLA